MRLQIPINGCLGPKSVKIIEVSGNFGQLSKDDLIVFEFDDTEYGTTVEKIVHHMPSGQNIAVMSAIYEPGVDQVIERFKAHYDVHED